MDQSSFASVYRTAAILAAFSRANGLGEPQPCASVHAAPSHGVVRVRFEAAIRRLVGVALEAAVSSRNLSWRPATRTALHDFDLMRAWSSRRLTAASTPVEAAAARPLVSHFSFCEGSDLYGPGQ